MVAAADDADVFIAENALGGGAPQHEPANHLTSRDAGIAARRAGVRRLVLSHFWPTANRERCRSEAAEEYAGPIDIARANLTFKVDAVPEKRKTHA